jgi:two-component system NarL family sensor kinase
MDAQEAKVYTVVLIVTSTVGVLLLYFFISLIRHQRHNLRLQTSLLKAQFSAVEVERARIAKDLHDDISPLLSFIKFQVQSAETISDEDRQQLCSASDSIDELVEKLRDISNDLIPSALLDKGLAAAVKAYLSKLRAASGLQVQYDSPQELKLSPGHSTQVFRIVQEVTHNTLRHANARSVEIKIEQLANGVRMLIRDDGCGFNLPTSGKEKGIGLSSIRSRVELMKGTMLLESIPGRGTAFLFNIPNESEWNLSESS